MDTKFGVQLKSKDDPSRAGRSGSPGGARTAGAGKRTELKTKPVSDLKAMFDKNDKEAGNKPVKELGTTYARKSTDLSSTSITKTSTVTAGGNKTVTVKTKETVTRTKSNDLCDEDKEAFEALRSKLKKTGISTLEDEFKEGSTKGNVAVAKTFNGGVAYKASLETKKVCRAGDDGDVPQSRGSAASVLSAGLLRLRTRPGSIQKEEKLSRSNSLEEENNKSATNSPRSESPRPMSPTLRELSKDSKYIPGAPKGWKSPSETSPDKSLSSGLKSGKFSDSAVGKLKQDTSVPKLAGFRSVSPDTVGNKNSSDDSSSSANISPRGYKPVNSALSPRKESPKKTDINENIRKFEANKSSASLSKDKIESANKVGTKTASATVVKTKVENTQVKSKLTTVEKTSVEKTKLNKFSGGLSSDSDRGRTSPKVRGDFKWTERGRRSVEDTAKHGVDKDSNHRPLSRASSSGSNSSSMSRGESRSISKLTERFASPEPDRAQSPSSSREGKNSPRDGKHSPRDSKTDISRKTMTKKMGNGKFQELKKGFEKSKESSNSPKLDKKLKTDFKSKKILERKESFEGGEVFRKKYERTEKDIPPNDKGKVLETIKSLNELDAKAKAKPAIVRRTQSLPSDSMEDDSSVDYYQDIDEPPHANYIMMDDASNEGDISSESDQLYEEISAHSAAYSNTCRERSPHKDRRATAFRKRRNKSEELPPVDTQTDSGSDTEYEYVEHDGYQVSESDSVDLEVPPELPPARPLTQKKKKKKDEKSRGLKEKFKKLYKGKNSDTEGALKNISSSGLIAAPQSGGVLSKFKKKDLKKSSKGDISQTNSQTNLEALVDDDNPYCDSSGTNTDIEVDHNKDSKVSRLPSADSLDRQAGMDNQSAENPPPLPPRHSGLLGASSGGDLIKGTAAEGQMVLPPSPDRRASGPVELKPDMDPPLPPRNRISQNLDLNLVVPVTPGGRQKSPLPCDIRKSGWPPSSDSYLHGQKIDTQVTGPTSPDIPYMDETPSPSDAPPLPVRPPPKRSGSGKDVESGDSAVPPLPEKRNSRYSSTGSYVDVGDDILPDNEYSLADEIRKELEKRPGSSAYIKPTDLSSVPEPRSNITAPFQDMLKFRGECEEDGLYIDLSSGSLVRQSDLRQSQMDRDTYLQPLINSDDQVYGTVGYRYHSQLETESLYQFYNKEKIVRASKRKAIYSSFDESDEEGYTEEEGDEDRVYEDLSTYSSGRGSMELDKKSEGDTSSTSSKLSTLDMFSKKGPGTIMRTMWSEMPEVKKSGILNTISSHEKKLQEALFEILTSEATYLKSINVLINVFLMSEEFNSEMSNKCVLSRQERHVLFSNIGTIRDTSERFLSELEMGWQKSVMLNDVCDTIAKHSSANFECYVHYCSNQTFQDKATTELKKKQDFLEALKRLEANPECQGLPMISFLLLPMQRITRLPLLVDAICHRLDPIKDKAKHKAAVNAFNALSKVVKKCNDGAKRMQQTEQMCLLATQIEFPTKEMNRIPLVSASRYLVKQGEVIRIASEAGSRIPFGKSKPGKQTVHMFLFSDILLITKKRGSQYIVTDYAQRNSLHIEMIDNPEKHRLLPNGTPSGCKFLFLLVMLENHQKLMYEAVFSCNSQSDRTRWVDALTPVKVTDDHERIYEEWDCPQVQCIEKYVATEPDELSLEESDVVNVFKKLDDGMWEGERMRDGERGWFPKDRTVEIINSHVRARNMRMKYRLMAAAETANTR